MAAARGESGSALSDFGARLHPQNARRRSRATPTEGTPGVCLAHNAALVWRDGPGSQLQGDFDRELGPHRAGAMRARSSANRELNRGAAEDGRGRGHHPHQAQVGPAHFARPRRHSLVGRLAEAGRSPTASSFGVELCGVSTAEGRPAPSPPPSAGSLQCSWASSAFRCVHNSRISARASVRGQPGLACAHSKPPACEDGTLNVPIT